MTRPLQQDWRDTVHHVIVVAVNTSTESPQRLRPALIAAIWSVPAVLSCMQVWATNRIAGHHSGLLAICAAQLPAWCVWAALTPALSRVANAAPPAWPVPRRSFASHLTAFTVCLALHASLIAAAALALHSLDRPAFFRVWRTVFVSWMPAAFLVYCATIGAFAWISAIERGKERARAEAELNEARTQAELAALRGQLHPHFLFNTLNTVAILIRAGDLAPAERVVTELGAILRELLRGARSHETTLANEVHLLRHYLAIEQLRFGSALRVEWAVPPDCAGALVPMLVLQPLVENAVRHGIAHLENGGTIEIGAAHDADRLTLRVANERCAQEAGATASEGGVGLDNTRRRLRQLYGERGRLTMTQLGARTVVDVELPFHPAVSITRDTEAQPQLCRHLADSSRLTPASNTCRSGSDAS